jgi:lysozyme family protein
MADFDPAFQKVLHDEGGFKLTNIPGDRGGMTYAGIARNSNPDWPGWNLVDHQEFGEVLTDMVRKFYKSSYWDRIRGDDITNQSIAENIFNFAVNTGIGVAAKLAQLIVGTAPDGAIGPATIEKLNTVDSEAFKKAYALAKIARYADICNRNKTQTKFLLGWIQRTLRGLK